MMKDEIYDIQNLYFDLHKIILLLIIFNIMSS